VLTPSQVPTQPGGGDAALCRRLQSALAGIGEAIVVCDGTGAVVYQNPAADHLLTARPAEALVVEAVRDLTRAALAGARPERKLELISPIRRSLAIRAFPTGGEPPDGAVVVVEDVSERQRLEAVRRDFVANVSHELKTPTGALTLLAETLDGETDPVVVARLVRRLGGEAERLSRIIDDLLDLSRIEANDAPARTLVPVSDFVTEALAGVQRLADSAGVRVEVGPLPAGVAVQGDRRDLVSAVANLVDNAVKYSDPGGTVEVSARVGPARVEVAVADRGPGIPARDLERIFERFYRVDRARSRNTGGTGLGLSIVRHVAVNHGGEVGVTSVEGEGSTFVLSLPVVNDPTGPDGRPAVGNGGDS
jgi:two-component system sensor histidine kinase SenX3